MIELQKVSYVRLGTTDLDAATTFATDYLGLEISYRSKDTVYLKSDQREHTLCYFRGSPSDQTVAFEVCERIDAGAFNGHDMHDVGIEHHQCPQRHLRALELVYAIECIERGVGHGEGELALS